MFALYDFECQIITLFFFQEPLFAHHSRVPVYECIHSVYTAVRGRFIPFIQTGCLMLWKKRRMNENQTLS